MSDELLRTGDLLQEITPEKRNLLATFIKCFQLVTWLRKSVKGKIQLCYTGLNQGNIVNRMKKC